MKHNGGIGEMLCTIFLIRQTTLSNSLPLKLNKGAFQIPLFDVPFV